jgi:hypothetical protein
MSLDARQRVARAADVSSNSPHVPIKAKIIINGSAQVNCRRDCFFLMRLLKDLAGSNAGKARLIAHIAQRAARRDWLDRSPE